MLDAGDVGFQPICRSWCEWTRDPWKSGNPCIQRFVSGRQDISLLIRWKSIQKQKTQVIEGLFLFMYFFVRSMLPRFKEYLLHSMWWTLQTFLNLEVLLSVPPFMLYFFFSWTFPSCLHHLHLPPKCCLPTACKLQGAAGACWCSFIIAALSNFFFVICRFEIADLIITDLIIADLIITALIIAELIITDVLLQIWLLQIWLLQIWLLWQISWCNCIWFIRFYQRCPPIFSESKYECSVEKLTMKEIGRLPGSRKPF